MSFAVLRRLSPQPGKFWDPGRTLISLGPAIDVRSEQMKKRLTDRFLQSVDPPAASRSVYIDSEAPGLELRVSSHGGKSWSIRYRPKGRERKRTTYGSYPVISLMEARARAKEIAAAAARGVDLPEQEKRRSEEERKASKRPQTVGDLLDRYINEYCKKNQRRWQLVERMFDMHVKPAKVDGRPLGEKPLGELRRADLVELLDDLQNEKGLNAQVNRVRSQVVAALNWAIEREYLDTSPAAAIKKRKIEASRDRVLNEDELRAIWRAAQRLSDPSRSLVQAWILTGQRRDEVRCMMWSEVDLDRALWTLPAARNKGKRDHEIPLLPIGRDRASPSSPPTAENPMPGRSVSRRSSTANPVSPAGLFTTSAGQRAPGWRPSTSYRTP
jgi:hypothetical protein